MVVLSMASTRRLEIFQDPGSIGDNAEIPLESPHNFIGNVFPNADTLRDTPLRKGIILNPPVSRADGRSPLKSIRRATNSPPKVLLDNNLNISLPPPHAPHYTTDSPLKRQSMSNFYPIAPQKFLKPIYTTVSSTLSTDKENVHPTYHSDNFAEFPDTLYDYQAPLSKPASHTTNHDRNSKKERGEETAIPEPEMMPLVADDGRKPPYSYAALIGMSILRAPGRRLTLAQIYRWISDTFSYYRLPETGWQNSIRHNLSLNKAFIKQERPKDDPGKGNYWAIEPGMETQFAKDKATRRPMSSSGPSMKRPSLLSSEANIWSSQTPQLPEPPKAAAKPVVRAFEVFEPSSDATIPASDAPSQEDEIEDIVGMPPPPSRLPASSPLQPIRSSPPIIHHNTLRDDTPSPGADSALPSSDLRSRKRKLAAMDDSGYFSSLDSSAKRPFADPKLPDLRADRPKIHRGRAEEEIARIRSSSHDISPSKGRSFLKQPTPSLVSSSPLDHFDTSQMLPPLTPAVKFKLPPKPPASISPNTNLRNHRNKIRELVGSPIKNTALFSDDFSLSPAFHILDDARNMFDDDYQTFSVFTNSNESASRRPASASPVKHSLRRPWTDRANKISNFLADVTGTNLDSKASSSSLIVPSCTSSPQQKSNKASLETHDNFKDVEKEELFGLDYLDDEDSDDFGGLDILQGFQKIGGSHNSSGHVGRSPRPARSHTARF